MAKNIDNLHISSERNFDAIEQKLAQGGPEKLHVIADFDRTLTLAFVNGEAVPSLTSILRNHNYLTPDYPARAKALYAHYGAIERDPTVPKAQKKKIMEEWWTKHFEILKECKLNKNDVEKAMTSGVVKFRPGVPEFLKILSDKNIPLIIMSASGLGGEAIRRFFKHENLLFPNIEIIGNEFVWDENGFAMGVREPIITGENKDETLVQSFPEIFEKIKDRHNVILIGDNLGDVGMVEGFPYDNLLKIGFLNHDVNDENINVFGNIYDALILNDGNFDYINSLLYKIIE